MAANRLLLLPAEMRARIYQYVFSSTGSHVEIIRNDLDDPSRGLCTSAQPTYRRLYGQTSYDHNSAILLTCQIFYKEAQTAFARCIELTFGYGALASDLNTFVQQRYLAHVEQVTVNYVYCRHFEVAGLPSLKVLQLDHIEDSLFADCNVNFLEFSTDEEESKLIDAFYNGANDDQVKACAKERYLHERTCLWVSQETSVNQRYISIDNNELFSVLPWVADAINIPPPSFRIVSHVWCSAYTAEGNRAREYEERVSDYDCMKHSC